MPRYAFKIEYNGKGFAGWQRQKDHITVQGEIETSLRNQGNSTVWCYEPAHLLHKRRMPRSHT